MYAAYHFIVKNYSYSCPGSSRATAMPMVCRRGPMIIGGGNNSLRSYHPLLNAGTSCPKKSTSNYLREHAHTGHGIRDVVLAQNRDVDVLSLKKLVQCEKIDQVIFPEDVRAFAQLLQAKEGPIIY